MAMVVIPDIKGNEVKGHGKRVMYVYGNMTYEKAETPMGV